MSFFEAIDPSFDHYVLGNAPVKQLATGFDWSKGRSGLAMRTACCSRTFPTTKSCAGRPTQAYRPTARRPISPMDTPAMNKDVWCRASTEPVA